VREKEIREREIGSVGGWDGFGLNLVKGAADPPWREVVAQVGEDGDVA
jgi:hypothetical protein